MNVGETATLDNVLAKYQSTFDGGLGLLNGRTAKLKLKENSKPIYKPARTVSYSLMKAVEDELDKWEKEGIIDKVNKDESTEWATPIVVVPKPDGKVRLCGDFKVTLN